MGRRGRSWEVDRSSTRSSRGTLLDVRLLPSPSLSPLASSWFSGRGPFFYPSLFLSVSSILDLDPLLPVASARWCRPSIHSSPSQPLWWPLRTLLRLAPALRIRRGASLRCVLTIIEFLRARPCCYLLVCWLNRGARLHSFTGRAG